MSGLDDHRLNRPRLNAHGWADGQGHGRGRPAAHQHSTSLLHGGRRLPLPESRVELDDHLHGTVLGGQPSDQQGGWQELAAHLGHHALGERQSSGIRPPGRLERCGVGEVPTADHGDTLRRRHPKPPCPRTADQATEHRVGVEARDAQPVDGSVGGDQRRRAGVTEQPVVLDRHVAGHRGRLRRDRRAARGRRRRRGGQRP